MAALWLQGEGEPKTAQSLFRSGKNPKTRSRAPLDLGLRDKVGRNTSLPVLSAKSGVQGEVGGLIIHFYWVGIAKTHSISKRGVAGAREDCLLRI